MQFLYKQHLLRSRYENATPNLCSVHYWVSCAIDCIYVDTHLPCLRSASLRRTNSRGDSCVLGVYLSNVFRGLILSHLFSSFKSFKVCWIFVKRTYFKSLLKVFYCKSLLKVFYRSAEGLLSICVCCVFFLSILCFRSVFSWYIVYLEVSLYATLTFKYVIISTNHPSFLPARLQTFRTHSPKFRLLLVHYTEG